MATIGENLRTVVLAIDGIGNGGYAMAQNIVPQKEELPYIWYTRDNEESPIFVDGSKQPLRSEFTIEVVTNDINTSIATADVIREELNGLYGPFGDQNVRGVQVQTKDDSYITRSDIDDGFHVSSLTVLIMH